MSRQTEINAAKPASIADEFRATALGNGLALIATTEQLVVTANLATPDTPAYQILRCFASVGGAPGQMAVAAPETTPAAGNCAVNELGQIEFAAADAITECEVTFIPVEGELITATIQVTAAGVGTLNNSRSSIQMVSAELNLPAATPAVKTQVARGTLVGALAAGQFAVQFAGTTLAFVAAEAGVACTADVVYYALPGVGEGAVESFGNRLRADDSDDAGI